MFVRETENVLASKEVGKDLISLTRLQQKHKVSFAWNKKILNGLQSSFKDESSGLLFSSSPNESG